MGKKDKSKFKKRLHAEIIKEIQQTESNPSSQTQEIRENVISKAKIISPPAKAADEKMPAGQDSLKLVRSDLKKSSLIIGSIIIVIIVLFFVDNRTGLLLKIGSSLFKLLRIGA